jgi:putative endonuclease
MNTTYKSTFGTYGENLVVDYLKKNGFTVLERNYKKFYGEIDIIAQRDDTIVFVEVKMRQKAYFELSTLIIPSKQRKIIKTAESYVASKHLYEHILRFDVALVEGYGDQAKINYIPHAFGKPCEFF